MKKKIVSILLAAMMALSMTACGGGSADTYTVGVCQLIQHPALDSATQGFQDALKEKLGDKVIFDVGSSRRYSFMFYNYKHICSKSV